MFRSRIVRLSILLAVLQLTHLYGLSPAAAATHRMFVTSASGSGDLSTWAEAGGQTGRAAGDQICRTLAGDAGLANAASFRAYLSTTITDAFCRVAGFSGQRASNCGEAALPDAGPWVRTDGKPFSHKLQRLTSSERIILFPAMLDEQGNLVPPTWVHTGTAEDGSVYETASGTYTCANWTSDADASNDRFGVSSSGSIWWASSTGSTCSLTGRLLCFEPGLGDPLPTFATPGSIVFVSSESGTGDLSTWPSAGGLTGLAAADHVCQTLAAGAGYVNPSSFVAWLSSGATAALDRLGSDGPWRRPGGVRVVASKAGLLSAGPSSNALLSDIEVDQLGLHAAGNIFTGTGTDGQPTGFDCAGWTSASPSETATFGYRNSAAGTWTAASVVGCDRNLRLYCFSGSSTVFEDDFESGDLVAWSAHH